MLPGSKSLTPRGSSGQVFRVVSGLIVAYLVLTASVAFGQKPVVEIGMVLDGPSERNEQLVSTYENEIRELLSDEYEVRIPAEKQLTADWTAEGVKSAVDRLYADPAVDIVLATGFVSSNGVALRGPLPKPTIAAVIGSPKAQGVPLKIEERMVGDGQTERIQVSGVSNLAYILLGGSPTEEIRHFQEVVRFSRLTVLYMTPLRELFPQLESKIRGVVAGLDLERVDVVPVGASLDDALAAIPGDTQAVYVSVLEQLATPDLERLAKALIERKLPSFSQAGADEVERGLLASTAPASTHIRRARRVALNIQSILSGVPAETLPVSFGRQGRLVINMATARSIGVSPPFVTLTGAHLINEERTDAPRSLSLSGVVREAENANLDLAIADRTVAAGMDSVRLARAALLPQVGVSGGALFIDKDRASFGAGQSPQRLLSGSVSASQLIYSDDVKSGYDIERKLQNLRQEERAQLRLDVVQEAAGTYLNILRAKTIERVQRENLDLTRSNLDLANVRVEIGQAGRDELYRWESQMAVNKRSVVDANAFRNQAEISLNRVLNHPVEELFLAEETGLDDPALVTSFENLRPYVESPAVFRMFRNFMSQEAFDQSPELRQITALVSARQRELKASQRSFYLPRVGVAAEGTYLGGRYGAGSKQPAPPLSSLWTNPYNWSVGITGSLPIFEGGAQQARLSRAREELQQANVQLEATRQRIEERLRSVLHQAGASFVGIELAQDAAEAAHRNLELVKDSYAEGVVDILRLLDAQNQALSADLAAANAIFDHLVDLMDTQRAVGRFDYFRSAEDRQEFLNRLDGYYRNLGYEVRKP